MPKTWLASLLCVALALPGAAGAQSGAKKPNKAQMKEAKRLYELADTSYRLQEWEQSLSLFQESYRLSQLPALLFNIAQCQRQLGRYEEAILSYKAFVSDAPPSDFHAEAERWISELEAELVRRKAEAERAAARALAAEERATQTSDEAQRKIPVSALGLYGGAFAAGALGGVLGGLALRTKAQLVANNDLDASDDPAEDLQRLARQALLSDVALGVAVLSAGTGAYLHLKARRRATPREEPSAQLFFSPTAARVSFSW